MVIFFLTLVVWWSLFSVFLCFTEQHPNISTITVKRIAVFLVFVLCVTLTLIFYLR